MTFEFVSADEQVLVVEGDLVIEGSFSEWFQAQRQQRDVALGLVIVTGDLIANDIVDAFVLVKGNLHCDYLYSEMARTDIVGDANIRYAYLGQYPSGEIVIKGITKVPFFLSSNHVAEVNLHHNTILIGLSDDGYFKYDLLPEDFNEVMLKGLWYQDDQEEEFETSLFVSMIKEGRSPFKNVSDAAFSIPFEKKNLLKKIRIPSSSSVTRFTIKSEDDIKSALEMPALKTLTIAKDVHIPQSLSEKASIKKLTINTQQLTNKKSVSAVGQFSGVEELVIKNTFWTWKLDLNTLAPKLFKDLKALKKLTVARMTQAGFDRLPSLKVLRLNIGDSSSIEGAHTELEELVIENSRGEMKNLHEFEALRKFSISGFHLNEMSSPLTLENLKEVKISTRYPPKNLTFFYALPNLKTLKITNTKLSPSDFEGIEECVSLKELSLKGCSLPHFPKQILGLQDLKKFNLEQCPITGEEHDAICKVLPNAKLVSDQVFKETTLAAGKILQDKENPCKHFLPQKNDYLRSPSWDSTGALYFDGSLAIEGNFDLERFGSEKVIVSGGLKVSGKLTSSSPVCIQVFGAFSAADVRLDSGSVHTYGMASVPGGITVFRRFFFYGPSSYQSGDDLQQY